MDEKSDWWELAGKVTLVWNFVLEKEGRKLRSGCALEEAEEKEEEETLGTPNKEKFWVTRLERENTPPMPPTLFSDADEMGELEDTATLGASERN